MQIDPTIKRALVKAVAATGSQRSFAQRIGLPSQNVSTYLTGRARRLSEGVWEKLFPALVEYLPSNCLRRDERGKLVYVSSPGEDGSETEELTDARMWALRYEAVRAGGVDSLAKRFGIPEDAMRAYHDGVRREIDPEHMRRFYGFFGLRPVSPEKQSREELARFAKGLSGMNKMLKAAMDSDEEYCMLLSKLMVALRSTRFRQALFDWLQQSPDLFEFVEAINLKRWFQEMKTPYEAISELGWQLPRDHLKRLQAMALTAPAPPPSAKKVKG